MMVVAAVQLGDVGGEVVAAVRSGDVGDNGSTFR